MRKFFYLMAMVCTLGFFTACSSDDDPSVWDTFQGGTYNVWGQQLDTEDNDLDYNYYDIDMKVEKAGDNTAKVTMNEKNYGILVTIPNAAIASTNDGYTLSGEGTMSIASIANSKKATKATASDDAESEKVSFKATIAADNKTVSVELKSDDETVSFSSENKPKVDAELSKLVGTWNTLATTWYDEDGNPVEAGDENADYPEGSFKMNWEAKQNTWITIPSDIAEDGMTLPVASAAMLAERMVNMNSFENILSSVAFTADGKIVARYRNLKDQTGKWNIAEGYATYQALTDDMILLYLNDDKILADVKDTKEKASLQTLLGMFKEGIPVNLRYTDNQVFFYLDKDFASTVASSKEFGALVANLKDEDLNGFGAMFKMICNQIPDLMKNTTKFEVGLTFVKD